MPSSASRSTASFRAGMPAAEHVFGYTSDQAVGRHISLIIPPERIAEEDEIVARLKAGERIEHFETERARSDGQRILVSLTISPIKDAAGTVVGASKIARDVTLQRRAEADREKFVTLVENSTDFIGMCDLNGIPFFVNRAGLEMVGLDSIEEARRTPLLSFFFPEDQQRMMDEFFPSVLEKGHGEIEIRFRHFKTGEARWMAYKVLTLPGADGRPVALATVSQEVTQRKRLEDDSAACGDRSVRSGPPQERVSGDAGARAAQSPCAHQQRGSSATPERRRKSHPRGVRNAGAPGRPDGPAGGRPARHEPHHARQD